MRFDFIKTKTFQITALVVILSALIFGIIVQQVSDFIPNIELNPNLKVEEYVVTDVIDGDTIEVTKDSEVLKVRYIGVDTPETVKPNSPVECFGKEASNFNKNLILNKKVKLEIDVNDTDSFGRKLRYVYLLEGENKDKMVNQILIEQGYANILTVQPDVKYVDQLKEAEKKARENNLGLWKECKN